MSPSEARGGTALRGPAGPTTNHLALVSSIELQSKEIIYHVEVENMLGVSIHITIDTSMLPRLSLSTPNCNDDQGREFCCTRGPKLFRAKVLQRGSVIGDWFWTHWHDENKSNDESELSSANTP